MPIAMCCMALGWPLIYSNSAENAFQTAESLNGVANSTVSVIKSANTGR